MKKLIAVAAGCLLIGGFAMNGNAAQTHCTVSAVKDTAVILDCGEQTGSLKVGSDVILKTKSHKKRAVVEGC